MPIIQVRRAAAVFIIIIMALFAAALYPVRTADAVEGGVGLVVNGYKGPMMGFLPPIKGAFFRNDVYTYFTAQIPRVPLVGKLHLNFDADSVVDFASMLFVTDLKIAGGQWAFGFIIPFGYSRVSADILTPAKSRFLDQSFAMADSVLTPLALGWHFGDLHLMGTWSVFLPTGQYSVTNSSDLGRNHVAFDQNVNLTWMEPKSGVELSAGAGYMVNLTNDVTDYTSGNEFHSDFVAAWHSHAGLMAGATGYAYQQITGDSGAGAMLGSFKGRVFSAGPIVGYDLKSGEDLYSFNLRYYREFGAKNRLQGNGVFFTFSTKL